MDFSDPLLAAAVFLALSVLAAQLLKRYANAQTFISLISVVRSTKPLPWFDKWSKLRGLNELAEFGLVLGFGVLALDFLYLRHLTIFKRALGNAAGFLVLFGVFQFVFSPMLFNSPMFAYLAFPSAIAFALFGIAGVGIVSLVGNALDIGAKISVGEKALPGVAPVIPGLCLPNVPICVPLHAWISLLIILAVHEGAHGLLARKNKIPLKSAGLLLFGFLPIGAFVEPEEKAFEGGEPRAVLRLLSAGATANLAFMALGTVIVLLFSTLVFAPFIAPGLLNEQRARTSGVQILQVSEFSEFDGQNISNSAWGKLEVGDIVKEVNGKPVSFSQEFISDARMDSAKMAIIVQRGSQTLSFLLEKNSAGVVGIAIENISNPDYAAPQWYLDPLVGWEFVFSFVQWLLLLSFLIAFVNFLPMHPFDGGKISVLLLTPLFANGKKEEKIVQKRIAAIFFYTLLFLMVVNAVPLLLP